MSKEKQIEEMAKDLAEAHHEMDVAWTNHFIDKEKFPKPKPEHTLLAEYLYNAGYRKQSEWISVEERLPEKEGKYLICTINGYVTFGYFTKTAGDKTELLRNNPHFDYHNVIYWMPLPEAPKMKGGAE